VSAGLEIDVALAHNAIKDAKTPREALERLSHFRGWFDGGRPEEARLYAWCLWLRENGHEDWVRYIRLLNNVLKALVSGDPDEIEFYHKKLKNTKEPDGWIKDFRKFLKGRGR